MEKHCHHEGIYEEKVHQVVTTKGHVRRCGFMPGLGDRRFAVIERIEGATDEKQEEETFSIPSRSRLLRRRRTLSEAPDVLTYTEVGGHGRVVDRAERTK